VVLPSIGSQPPRTCSDAISTRSSNGMRVLRRSRRGRSMPHVTMQCMVRPGLFTVIVTKETLGYQGNLRRTSERGSCVPWDRRHVWLLRKLPIVPERHHSRL
jgi:hypothetical protein